MRLMTTVPLARRLTQSVSGLLIVGLLISSTVFFGWVAVEGMRLGELTGVPFLAIFTLFAVAVVPVAVALVRAIRAVPHLLLVDDDLLLHDPRILRDDYLLGKGDIERVDLIESRKVLGFAEGVRPRLDEFGSSPFDERWNIRLRFTRPLQCELGRQGFFGNWIWSWIYMRPSQPVAAPQWGEDYMGFVINAQHPTEALAELQSWLG